MSITILFNNEYAHELRNGRILSLLLLIEVITILGIGEKVKMGMVAEVATAVAVLAEVALYCTEEAGTHFLDVAVLPQTLAVHASVVFLPS